jgi:hypothetical protein
MAYRKVVGRIPAMLAGVVPVALCIPFTIDRFTRANWSTTSTDVAGMRE